MTTNSRSISRTEYASLIKECGNSKLLSEAKQLHAHMIKDGHGRDLYLGNLLVEMYSKCQSLGDACQVFDNLIERNVFSWTIMAVGYAQNGDLQQAQIIFEKMPDTNVVSWTAMLASYAHYGHVEYAKATFDKMPVKNVISWNAMIGAYARNGHRKDAVLLFVSMDLEGVYANEISYITVLDVCNSAQGKTIHATFRDSYSPSEVKVGNALISMYGKCEAPDAAKLVFDEMNFRNIISWNAVILAYARNGFGNAALILFREMDLEGVRADSITFVTVLDACSSIEALQQGKMIHDIIVLGDDRLETELMVGSSLVNMYAKCGSMQEAKNVFERMPVRDMVSWTGMITAYAQNDLGKEAMHVFRRVELEGLRADEYTYVGLLDACTNSAALMQGNAIHERVKWNGLKTQGQLGNALVNMYGKCGSVQEARSLFDKLIDQDSVAWTSMIKAYAQHGYCDEAISMFNEMKLMGVKPREITFIAVLYACNHNGLWKNAEHHFQCIFEYGLKPLKEHYLCMIDLLVRSGHLQDAEELIDAMPYLPDAVTWTILVGGCRLHGDVERGARAAKHIFEMESEEAGPFMLLQNLYAACRTTDLRDLNLRSSTLQRD